jgi:Gram-negative bacterial TonB protein C-terminal
VVVGGSLPLYPQVAHMANIQGVVRVRVSTDGHRVTEATVKEGERLLAAAAEQNVRTWQFHGGEPAVFTVTYHYRVVEPGKWKGDRDNAIVILRLPAEVEVSVLRWPPVGDLAPDKTRK